MGGGGRRGGRGGRGYGEEGLNDQERWLGASKSQGSLQHTLRRDRAAVKVSDEPV